MVGNRQKWREIAWNGWKWLEMTRKCWNGWKWLEVAQSRKCWKWLDMAGMPAIAGIAGNGWKWFEMA